MLDSKRRTTKMKTKRMRKEEKTKTVTTRGKKARKAAKRTKVGTLLDN